MINKLKLSRLVSGEFYEFMVLILKIVDSHDPDALKIKAVRDVFEKILNRLLVAYQREQASALTELIDALDLRRDNAIIGFTEWSKSLQRHPNPTKKESAKAIVSYLKNYGSSIAGQNNQQESATLTKIVSDFTNDPVLKQHLANLNDPEWLEEINDSNTKFIDLYQKRTTELGSTTNKESFTAVRKEMVPQYESLVELLESRYKTAKADNLDVSLYETTLNEINATITQYRQLIKQTQPRKKKEEGN